MKVAYIDHPCSKEQKDKLTKEGYKVVDSRFKPQVINECDLYVNEKKPSKKPRTLRNRDK